MSEGGKETTAPVLPHPNVRSTTHRGCPAITNKRNRARAAVGRVNPSDKRDNDEWVGTQPAMQPSLACVTPTLSRANTARIEVPLKVDPSKVAPSVQNANQPRDPQREAEDANLDSLNRTAFTYTGTRAHETFDKKLTSSAAAAGRLKLLPSIIDAGQMEYDDPLLDEYAHNPVVANNNIHLLKEALHEMTCSCPCHGCCTCCGVDPEAQSQPADPIADFSSSVTPSQDSSFYCVYPANNPITGKPNEIASFSSHKGAKRKPNYFYRIPPEPPVSFDPFKDTKKCLGRLGYTDYRLTFHRVQADPKSTMYVPEVERFQSVSRVPLYTPTVAQERWDRVYTKLERISNPNEGDYPY